MLFDDDDFFGWSDGYWQKMADQGRRMQNDDEYMRRMNNPYYRNEQNFDNYDRPSQQHESKGNTSVLNGLGTDLTQLAKEGKLDPVIGRDKEIQEIAEVLSRRTKNNPVLIGKAGVGKTAVVEGLAEAIVKGKVPETIKNKKIIRVDLSSLTADTELRGSYEKKVQNLIKGVTKHPDYVIFFDEIHQIIGNGSLGDGQGSKGLSDIIKPALSRGEFSVIGATTENEYHQTIQKDSALDRRFNPVKINEPTSKATFTILKGLAPEYEKHHHVKIDESALKAAVDLSVRYLPQRTLPDKAIDLIDMTSAHVSAHNFVTNESSIKTKIKDLNKDIAVAVKKEDFETAANDKKEIKDLKNQLKNNPDKNGTKHVKVDDIAKTVERMTGIPVTKITSSDADKLKNLKEQLSKVVINQNEAISAVTNAIIRNRTGFGHVDKPISFLFVGPTGTGKTLLAKTLAKELFGSEKNMIRLDMSEYEDNTSLTKLLGVSQGYVGYNEDNNSLPEQVRRNPYSIILLDEFEKASPEVMTAFLQLLDDGRMTAGNGTTVDFKNTIIIATSNAGFSSDAKNTDNRPLIDTLKLYFRPELLNRFDEIIKFNKFDNDEMKKIIVKDLKDNEEKFIKKNIKFDYTDELVNYIAKHGIDSKMGARPLNRFIDKTINTQAANELLKNNNVKEMKFDVKDDKLVVTSK